MNLILISLGIILIIAIIWIVKNNRSYIPENNQTIPSQAGDETTPDSPISFGYKCTWLAIRTENIQKISELLKLKRTSVCNWKYGINKAYDNSIFICPPIDGWVLVVGNKLPDGDGNEIQELLITLSKEFQEAQFFATHRVTEYHCWIKALNGKIIRLYSFLGESGENISVEGKPTEFEKKYNLINTFSKEAEDSSYFERKDLTTPDEEFIMQVADNWSINPMTLDNRIDVPKGLGIIGKR